MPTRPPRVCVGAGCTRTTTAPRCPECEAKRDARRRSSDRGRGSASSRGYGRQWRRARLAYLQAHPLCVTCEARGHLQAATEVDHIDPHRGDPVKFWDVNNWQGLCKPCHSEKTAREDGGFGRRAVGR